MRWGINRYQKTLLASVALGGVLAGGMVPASAAVQVSATPDRSWTVNGRVYATKIVGGIAYVGGQFTSAVSPSGQTVARQNLAAFNLSDGSLVTGWQANANRVVYSLDSDGSALYAGGNFTSVRGTSRSHVAKLSLSTGAVDGSFTPSASNGLVRGIDVDGSSLFIGGQFTTVGGASHGHVAKLNAGNGNVVAAFAGGANDQVRAVRMSPTLSRLYVVGDFTSIGGGSRAGVAGVDSNTGQVAGPAFSGSTKKQYAVDVSADGSQVFSGADSNVVSAWNVNTGSRQWRIQTDGNIQALRYHSGTVYFGFHDGYQGNTRVKLLAADAGNGHIDSGFEPTMTTFWGVFAIDATASAVVIGGDLTRVNGVTAQGWARFR